MAALTADQIINTHQTNGPNGIILDYPVAATTVIYEGGWVSLNSAGYLTPYLPQINGTTAVGNRLLGLALEHIASQTSAGDAKCKVLVEGMFQDALASAVIADVGKPVFLSDDNTLSKVALGNRYVGHIQSLVSAGNVLVRFNNTLQFNSLPVIERVSPAVTVTALTNMALLIDPTENHNGLIITRAFAIVTTAMAGSSEDQGEVTLQDTDGTTLGIVMIGTNTTPDVAGDIILPTGTVVDNHATPAATGAAVVIVPADKGVRVKCTQATAGTPAGAVKVYVKAVPIA